MSLIVDTKLKEKWHKLYTHGDISDIQRSMPKKDRVTNENIRICVKKGEFANMKVFEAVAKFYKEKAEKIKELSEYM